MRERRVFVIIAATAVLAAACSAHASAATPSKTAYATGLTHVAAMTTDADGRLWVATADSQDSGADGVYLVASKGATPVKIISALHTPLGLVWYHGALYVASKERVDAYSGLANNSFAQRRKILSLPKGVGENNNLVLAPDGRMVMGISAPCDHCTPASNYSGAIVSFTPDGKDLRVNASKIRAPVGLAYFPGTSDLFVTMNQRDDLGDATPGDTLALVGSGTSWGAPACYDQGGTACTGVPQPTAVLDKHAAVSGVAIDGNAALVAEWSTGKVLRVALTKTGTTYTSAVTTFLSGLKSPTAIVVTSSNTVLVGEWASGTIWAVAT